MLALTPRAWRVIDDLTHQHHAAAIRLTRTESGSLALEPAAGPEHDDVVVWSQGTVVYVDRSAAPAVDSAVLDLRSDPGARAFYFR